MVTKSKLQKWENEARFDTQRAFKQPKSKAWYDNWDRAFEKGIYAKNKKTRRDEDGQEAY